VEGDESKMTKAIASAIDESKMYLTRYDIKALFGDKDADVSATFTPDDMLLDIIKTLAVWKIMSLSKPSLDMEEWRIRYNQMKETLKDIQSGIADPRWPYQEYQGVTTPDSIEVTVHANQKQINDY